MKIGITFDLKGAAPRRPDAPDDADEEYDSPHTIDAIARVLVGMGHTVTLLEDGRAFLEKVLVEKPDFVFNFAEGHGISRSREARVPAVLEMLGIPYTGSDPFTMAVTLDKDCAKKIVAHVGVAVPSSVALEPDAPLSSIAIEALRFPLVVKPAWEGSSKGIRNKCLVHHARDLPAVIADVRRDHAQTVLLEEYIQGEELTVGLIGNGVPDVLGILRVVPNVNPERFIYSLEMKREYYKHVTYQCPPQLPQPILDRTAAAAQSAFRALSCRDVARIDFRVRDGVPHFLEVNALPGLDPDYSDLILIANGMGWSYEKLISTIVASALKRCGISS